ncbi:hypothetical protein ACEPPN_008409 [Leptodophora sp. 'Broadleaf-Isolate-01']
MAFFKLVDYMVPILTFHFGVLFYNLYRLHTNDQAITKEAFNSQKKLTSRLPASRSKSNTEHANAQSSTPLRTSLSVTETVDVLGKWIEELENEGEPVQKKKKKKKKKKRKFLGGLFGERQVVEGFEVKDKTVKIL